MTEASSTFKLVIALAMIIAGAFDTLGYSPLI